MNVPGLLRQFPIQVVLGSIVPIVQFMASRQVSRQGDQGFWSCFCTPGRRAGQQFASATFSAAMAA